MKLWKPLFALLACVVLSGCEDEEYNETGAVPPGEVDEFAADEETTGGTDAVIILEDTEGESGMNDESTYQSAKPAIEDSAKPPIEGIQDSAGQTDSQTDSKDTPMTSGQGSATDSQSSQTDNASSGTTGESSGSQSKSDSPSAGSQGSSSDGQSGSQTQKSADQKSDADAAESDVIDEVE